MKLFGESKYHKREIVALALSAVIIGGIFMPYPDSNAVQVKLTHLTTADGTGPNLQVIAQDPSAITFPNGQRTETIPSTGEIRVTLDPGTANEKSAIFNFTGHLLSDSSGGIIKGLEFDGITHNNKPGTFGTGSFYGYGAGFFSGTFTNGEIGDGSTVTGISSQPYGQNTKASYEVQINTMLLSTGNHVIRVDVLAHPGDTNFFSTGDVTFFNKQVTKNDKDDTGDKNAKGNDDDKSGNSNDDKNTSGDTGNNNSDNDNNKGNNNSGNDDDKGKDTSGTGNSSVTNQGSNNGNNQSNNGNHSTGNQNSSSDNDQNSHNTGNTQNHSANNNHTNKK